MVRLNRRFPLYSRLIRLYPPDYQAHYGQPMLQTLADMLDNAATCGERTAIWAHVALDFPVSLVQQDINYLGGIMNNGTPRYIKQNALIAALLIAPFMLALIANATDRVATGQTLYNSWLWRTPILSLWVLWLPLVALLLAGITFVIYTVQHSRHTSGSLMQRFLAIKHTWPLLGIMLIGLGILAILIGHDSVHCVLGNPLTEARHWPQTWQCVSQGAATYHFEHPIDLLRHAFGF